MLFPVGLLPDGPPLDTKKALVLLDFQNDFVTPSGKLCTENTATFLSKLPQLVSRFRDKGEVVWTCTEYRQPSTPWSLETGGSSIILKQFIKTLPRLYEDHSSGCPTSKPEDEGSQVVSEHDCPTVEPDPEAFLAAHIPDGFERCCVPSSSGAQISDALLPSIDRRKDIVTVKTQYSAFADMMLLMQLRTRMVTHLYICGSLSNISVYATALDAVRHGFQVTVIEDCLGYRDEACHVSAMRHMADDLCVEGIDYQELMDDLAGLLGDVIKEDAYLTRFDVDMSRSTRIDKRSTAKHVGEWIASVENHASPDRKDWNVRPGSSGPPSNDDESSGNKPSRQRSPTIESSPPRKRSTNDIDGDLEVSPHVKLSHPLFGRRSSHDAYNRSEPKTKKNKIRIRRSVKEVEDTSKSSQPQIQQSLSTGDAPGESTLSMAASSRTVANMTSDQVAQQNKKVSKKMSQHFLGPADHIGDGTSRIVHDVVTATTADSAFQILKSNTKWQKMYHRSGPVPRLVAVQGDLVTSSVDISTTYPIYRHPADESPELLPFDHTVNMLRQECEKQVGHTLNHVLIQYYRNGEDNISEHSDKTLDIVRGSNIVNLSLGAMRTMTLRAKRADTTQSQQAASVLPRNGSTPTVQYGSPRATQRVRLPHASLFILSWTTNAKYLHAVRADKRRVEEKSEAELGFGGERISLTFRHVGTYITKMSDGKQLIWGQGATGKSRGSAKAVASSSASDVSHVNVPDFTTGRDPANETTILATDLQEADTSLKSCSTTSISGSIGNQSQTQAERLIVAFGKENHEGETFDWDAVYGSGFDVVNFVTRSIMSTCADTE